MKRFFRRIVIKVQCKSIMETLFTHVRVAKPDILCHVASSHSVKMAFCLDGGEDIIIFTSNQEKNRKIILENKQMYTRRSMQDSCKILSCKILQELCTLHNSLEKSSHRNCTKFYKNDLFFKKLEKSTF